MITADEVRRRLAYDPDTGVFTYRICVARRVHVGDVAGSIDTTGHRQIKIFDRGCAAHRLAWLYVHGEWPTHHLDHINGVKDDNRICNLRAATRAQNLHNRGKLRNNTTGFKGVCLHRRTGKFGASIRTHGRQRHLGYFDTPEAAYEAYCAAAAKLHGEFANFG